MSVSASPAQVFDPLALNTLQALEDAYVQARIFRTLLVPRMLAIVFVALVAVLAVHLPWIAFDVTTLVAAGLIVLVVRVEWRARRRWTAAARDVTAAMRLRPRIDIRPTAP